MEDIGYASGKCDCALRKDDQTCAIFPYEYSVESSDKIDA